MCHNLLNLRSMFGKWLLKGTEIESGCVIGAGSVVTNHTETDKNCILIGAPARITKRDIEWKHER